MVNRHIIKYFIIILLMGLSSSGHAMSRQPTAPVLMEFVQVIYEKSADALVIDLVLPEIADIDDLSRIEVQISDSNNTEKFTVILVYGYRPDPIATGSFGVLVDPGNEDRSINNILNAGLDGRWDISSDNGTLLEQSIRGVIGGNLGLSLWIRPKNWEADKYVIKTRIVSWNSPASPWQKLAVFDYSEQAVSQVIRQACSVKLLFIDLEQQPMSFEQVRTVRLIRYQRQLQDEGVNIKRWSGDTASQYKYIAQETQQLILRDYSDGIIPLQPGIYQFKHNSVSGQPSSGYYGSSYLFSIKPGQEFVDVKVFLYPAI